MRGHSAETRQQIRCMQIMFVTLPQIHRESFTPQLLETPLNHCIRVLKPEQVPKFHHDVVGMSHKEMAAVLLKPGPSKARRPLKGVVF